MWQKAVAGMCVMAGAFGFGWSLCQEMSCVLSHFCEQRRLLALMIREISFMHRPMQEIFPIVGERLKDPYKEFLYSLAKKMEQRSGKNLQELWKSQSELLKKNGGCPREALVTLLQIGDCFGCEEDKMQMDLLKMMEAELSEEISVRAKEKEGKSKLIQTLSVLAGIFCIVLFL